MSPVTLRQDLNAAWDRFRDEEDAWVGILTANGSVFCAGADLNDGDPPHCAVGAWVRGRCASRPPVRKHLRNPGQRFPDRHGVRIALTYGADTDWVRDVAAAGGCQLRTRGRTLTLTAPKVVRDPTRSGTRAFERRVLRALRVEDLLDLTEQPLSA